MTKELGPEDALTRLTSQPKSHRIVVYDLESKDGPSQRPGFTRVFLGGVMARSSPRFGTATVALKCIGPSGPQRTRGPLT